MKASTIILLSILLTSVMSNDFNNDCASLRIGTRKGATDVMLDGSPTSNYHQYRRIKNEDDVEVDSRTDESSFYLSGIKLNDIPDLELRVARDRLASTSSEVSTVGDNDKTEFKVVINYDCAEDLAGITDVFMTFTLDGTVCDTIGKQNQVQNSFMIFLVLFRIF